MTVRKFVRMCAEDALPTAYFVNAEATTSAAADTDAYKQTTAMAWDKKKIYAEEIGVCRTFVFFHEIEFLFRNNLVKGGDVDNAIVIVEHPVTDEQIEHMSKLFNVPKLKISSEGYLNNLTLRFPNECARHKLLDLIGDLRLIGGFLNAKVTAYKSGHSINTKVAAMVADHLK